jgi:hypothetical protein
LDLAQMNATFRGPAVTRALAVKDRRADARARRRAGLEAQAGERADGRQRALAIGALATIVACAAIVVVFAADRPACAQ